MICECPAAAAIPTIPVANCVESFGQIQKVAFQRLVKDDGTKNAFDSAAEPKKDIKALASWTGFISANDSTKIAISP